MTQLLGKTIAMFRDRTKNSYSGVSRHNGGPITGPFQPLDTIVFCYVRGAHNRAPMMPRDASLSVSYTPDRRCLSRPASQHEGQFEKQID